MIIGIAGPLAVGKDTLAGILAEAGFVNYSYGDALRKICDSRGLAKDIKTLVAVADEIRAKDAAALTKMLLHEMHEQGVKDAVLSGIRAPAEARALLAAPEAILVWLDAPIEERYRRVVSRGTERDRLSFEEFKAREEQQMKGIDTQINLLEIRDMATMKISNTGDKEELRKKIRSIGWI